MGAELEKAIGRKLDAADRLKLNTVQDVAEFLTSEHAKVD
jgi:hypothetical protein